MRGKERQKATNSLKILKMDKMQLSKNFSFGSTWSNLVVPKIGFLQSKHFFQKPIHESTFHLI